MFTKAIATECFINYVYSNTLRDNKTLSISFLKEVVNVEKVVTVDLDFFLCVKFSNKFVKNSDSLIWLYCKSLSYDRLYTSISLVQWLLEQKIPTIGTIQANRKVIPNEIKQVCNRDINSYKVCWYKPEKNINLNFFIVYSKTTGKRNILILSTMYPIFGISKDQKRNRLYTSYIIIRKEVQTL